MIPADTDPESSLAQVREWLPWFAAGGLAPDERQFVQTWLARQGPQHPELAAELEWLRCTAAQVRELADVQRPAPESGLAELMARIGAERPGAALAVRPWPQRFSLWLAGLLAPRPAFAFGWVAALLVQAAVIAGLLTAEPARQLPLGATLGSPAADSVVFSVGFSAQSRESEIRAVLQGAGVQIVAGPSALGLYRVSVPTARAEAALAALRSSTQTVESVQREP